MDPRRERLHKMDTFRQFMPIFDLHVGFFPLDRAQTDSHEHPIYDEGPERRYLTERLLQVFWVVETENMHVAQPEGRMQRRTIAFGTDVDALHHAGIDGPLDAWFRVDDMIKYRDQFFSVWQWEPKGHLGMPGHPTVIHVEAHLREPIVDLPDDLYPQGQVDVPQPAPVGAWGSNPL